MSAVDRAVVIHDPPLVSLRLATVVVLVIGGLVRAHLPPDCPMWLRLCETPLVVAPECARRAMLMYLDVAAETAVHTLAPVLTLQCLMLFTLVKDPTVLVVPVLVLTRQHGLFKLGKHLPGLVEAVLVLIRLLVSYKLAPHLGLVEAVLVLTRLPASYKLALHPGLAEAVLIHILPLASSKSGKGLRAPAAGLTLARRPVLFKLVRGLHVVQVLIRARLPASSESEKVPPDPTAGLALPLASSMSKAVIHDPVVAGPGPTLRPASSRLARRRALVAADLVRTRQLALSTPGAHHPVHAAADLAPIHRLASFIPEVHHHVRAVVDRIRQLALSKSLETLHRVPIAADLCHTRLPASSRSEVHLHALGGVGPGRLLESSTLKAPARMAAAHMAGHAAADLTLVRLPGSFMLKGLELIADMVGRALVLVLAPTRPALGPLP